MSATPLIFRANSRSCKAEIDSDRDGVVQQWFATEADFRASHGRADSPTRTDTFAHVSRFESP